MWVPGKIDIEGLLTVPARLFTDLVKGLPAGERWISTSGRANTPRVRAGRYQTHLRGIDAEEFPVIPSAGDRPTTRIAQKVLRKALSKVTFAAASDESRPILTGVLTHFNGERLTLAAADNYRMRSSTCRRSRRSRRSAWWSRPSPTPELMRLLTDSDEPVDVMLAQGQGPGHLQGRHDRAEPADRWPVPELPAGGAHQPRHAGSGRAGGAAQGGLAVGAHRQLGGQRRQAAPRRRGPGASISIAAA